MQKPLVHNKGLESHNFVPDNKKAGGAYISCSGCVKKIDEYEHTVVMEDKTVIPIEQISDIEGEMFGDMF